MAYRALIDFIDELEQNGDLLRVGAEINPDLELAEIAGRMAAVGGPALLFQNVIGCRSAMVANLLATEARACRALGIDALDDISTRVRDSLSGQGAGSWMDRLKWSGAATADRWQPRQVKSGACQQVVRHGTDVDLFSAAFIRSWPQEAARFNQAALLFWIDPDGARLCEACDLQLLDRNRVALMTHPRQPIARTLADFRDRGQRMPVAIAMGGDPAYRLLSVESLRLAIDPLSLAGLLREQAIEMVKCRSMDLGVPSDADVVLEGFIDPAEPWLETGPVGLSSGFYSAVRSAPVMHCVAMTERSSPICPVAAQGHTGGEAAVLQRAASRILLPLAQLVAPELVDMTQPALGGPRSYLFASIRKSYSGQAWRVGRALLGWEPLMATKFVVIVDDDVNLSDPSAVWSRIGAHVHPPRDINIQPSPGDPSDHAAPQPGLGHATIIDATAKLPPEHPLQWPRPLADAATTRQLVDSRWRQYGLPPLESPARPL